MTCIDFYSQHIWKRANLRTYVIDLLFFGFWILLSCYFSTPAFSALLHICYISLFHYLRSVLDVGRKPTIIIGIRVLLFKGSLNRICERGQKITTSATQVSGKHSNYYSQPHKPDRRSLIHQLY